VWKKASSTPSPWWMSMSMYSTRRWYLPTGGFGGGFLLG
jgi:hypothetical protein